MITQEVAVKNRLVIVVRLSGEIGTKAPGTRKQFTARLVANIAGALRTEKIEHKILVHWDRLDVETDDERAVKILSRVFGIQKLHYSRAYTWTTLEDVVRTGTELYGGVVAGRRFAVEARRVGQRAAIPFTSQDAKRALGAALVHAGGQVDLSDPEVTVGVELRGAEAFFFDHELSGPAGLPTGVEGKALSLMSGGFDSAVASWMFLKRGVAQDFLFFDLGGPPHQQAVREVTHFLSKQWVHGYSPKLHIVDFRPLVAEMKRRVAGNVWQLLLKRLMVRAGHLVAVENNFGAMITGESLGQVSSQTMSNLGAIAAPITTPIFRPLIGFNKDEIITIAKSIGTYELCAGVPEFCALGGGKPVIRSTVDALDEHESLLDPLLLPMLVQHRRILSMREFLQDPSEITVEVEEIPAGAQVIDLRVASSFKGWSYPGSVHLDYDIALEQFQFLPRGPHYLLCCEVGLKSALLAEALRKMDYQVSSLRGGLRTMRRLPKSLK